MGIFDKILGKTQPKADQPMAGANKSSEKKLVSAVVEKEIKSEKSENLVSKKVKAEKPAKIVKPKKEVAKRKIAKKEENIAHKVLLENLISEKATMLASQNKYVFKVDKHAGKFQIKEAVEGYYGVQVVSVNTIKISPKKRIHGRTIGWKKGFKKAVVTLREGDAIAAVEGV